jgi:plastocyanin
MMRRLALVALASIAVVTSAHSETVRITIQGLAFSPTEITAKVGDTIEWMNGDFVDHTATAKGAAWDIAIAAGKSGQFKLTQPGTVAYYCKIHPNMTGTVHIDAK